MEHETILTLTILKAITVAIGAAFLALVAKAWFKHRAPALAILFIAIGLMTVAAVAEGFMYNVLGSELDTAHTVEAVFTLAAFAVLLWSVLAHKVE